MLPHTAFNSLYLRRIKISSSYDCFPAYYFVIVVNIICWGMLIAGIVGFIAVLWALITDKENHKGNTPGLLWF